MKLPKIERLPSGSYRAQVQINGQRHSVTGTTEKEVEREVAALKLQLKKAPIPANALTLSEAVDRYIDARENVLSPSTIRGYREIRRNRFSGSMGKKINELNTINLQKMVDLESKICSPKTVKNAWGLVRSVIVQETGQCPAVRLPQVPAAGRPFLDSDQIKVFVDGIRGKSFEVAALLALSSLRASEIKGLKWSNVDMDKKLIRVSGAAVLDSDNQLVAKKTNKNRSSSRSVPIIEPLYKALQQEDKNGEYVVSLTTNYVYQAVNEMCEKLGLPKVGLHGLRHSFASLAYSLGMPEKITMEIGGWSDDGTMKRIYTHIAQKDRFHYESEFTSFFTSESKNAHESAHEK